MTLLPSGSLEITNVNYPDRGSYKCVASGGLVSREADLNLKALVADAELEAPQFLAAPRTQAVEVGAEVTLECAANGLPQPQITWLRDGRELDLESLDSRISRTGSGSLSIRRVEVGDEGGYQCRAENTEDSLDSGLELSVTSAPAIIKKPTSHVSYEKDDVLFDCEVTGRPEPEVRWYKNGDLIIQSEYFQVNHHRVQSYQSYQSYFSFSELQIVRGSSLKILGLVASDAGVYQCIATNSVSSAAAAAQLQVKSQGINITSRITKLWP